MITIADGKVVIDVEVDARKAKKETVSLEKDLESLGKESNKTSKETELLGGNSKKAGISFGKLATSLGLAQLATKVVSAGFNMVKSSVSGAIDRFDTLERFPKVMEQLGFKTEDSEKAMSKLSDGIQGLPTPLQDVVSTAQGLAVMTGDLDGATETTLALNNAFLASGSSTSDAKRGLQQYTQMLSKGEVDLQSWRTLQETMGLALNDVAKSFGFAGKSAQQDLFAALQSGEITFDEFNAKLVESDQKVGGFADQALVASKGIKTSWANVGTAITSGLANMIKALNDGMVANGFGTISDLVEKLKESIQEMFKKIVEEIPKVIEKITEIKDKFKEWEEILQPFEGLILGVIGGFVAFGTVVSVMNKVRSAIDLVKGSIDLMNLAMLANPIALAIGLVVALGIALYVASRKSEKFAKIVDDAFKKMKEDVQFVIDWLVENVPKAFEKMGEDIAFMEQLFRDIWQGIKDGAQNMIDDLVFIKEFFEDLWQGIKDGASYVWSTIGESWNKDVQFIKDDFNDFVDFFVELWDSITVGATELWTNVKTAWSTDIQELKDAWETVSTFFTDLWESIKELAKAGWESITNAIMEVLEPYIEIFKEHWENMKTIVQEAFEGILQITTSIWELIKLAVLGPVLLLIDLVTGDFEGFNEDLSAIWEKIKENAGLLWDGIVTVITSYVDYLAEALSLAWELITTVAITAWTTLKEEAEKQWNELSELVLGVITKLKDEALLQWNELKDKVSEANVLLKDAATKDWEQIKTAVETASKTLKDSAIKDAEELKNKVVGASTTLKTEASSQWNELKTLVNRAGSNIRTQASTDWSQISSTVSRLAQSAKDGATRAWETLKTATNNAFEAVKGFIEGPLREIDLFQIGKDIIGGLVRGVNSMFGKVTGAIGDLADKIKGGISKALSIKSPSRWMRDKIGKMIPRGLAVGIETDTDVAEKAMLNASNKIKMASIQPELALGIGGKMSTRRNSMASNVSHETKNTTNDNGVTVIIEKIINNTTDDIAEKMEDIAWVLGRQGGRLEHG